MINNPLGPSLSQILKWFFKTFIGIPDTRMPSGSPSSAKYVYPNYRPYSLSEKEEFYSSKEWKRLRYSILVRDNGRCCCCGRSAKDGVRLHVDHIIPTSVNWDLRLEPNNLQVLCEDCNLAKRNKDTINWRKK